MQIISVKFPTIEYTSATARRVSREQVADAHDIDKIVQWIAGLANRANMRMTMSPKSYFYRCGTADVRVGDWLVVDARGNPAVAKVDAVGVSEGQCHTCGVNPDCLRVVHSKANIAGRVVAEAQEWANDIWAGLPLDAQLDWIQMHAADFTQLKKSQRYIRVISDIKDMMQQETKKAKKTERIRAKITDVEAELARLNKKLEELQ